MTAWNIFFDLWSKFWQPIVKTPPFMKRSIFGDLDGLAELLAAALACHFGELIVGVPTISSPK